MGLGKTIMTLALIHSHKREEEKKEEDESDPLRESKLGKGVKKVKKSMGSLKLDTKNKKAGTLIVMPVTVMSQWEAEILNHSNEGTMKVIQYYGCGRKKVSLDDFDIVLTTYGTLSSEYIRNKGSGLFSHKWFRVILDEGHYIKGI